MGFFFLGVYVCISLYVASHFIPLQLGRSIGSVLLQQNQKISLSVIQQK